MSTINRISQKRLDKIAAGKIKLAGRSTFEQMSLKEVIEQQTEMSKRVRDALFGKSTTKVRSPYKKAEDKAWDQFSLFIRLRDSDANGIIRCCTCGKMKHWKRMQAGHYMSRRNKATLFDERNVHGQCAGCNAWQGGRAQDHAVFIDRKYGQGAAEKIRIDSKKECRRRITDLPWIEEEYRKKVEEFRKTSPGKFLIEEAHSSVITNPG